MKKIAIYIRAKDVSPSGYYRILQYTDRLEGRFYVHNILPPRYYKWYLKKKHIFCILLLLNIITFMLMYVRCSFFLLSDYLKGMDVVVISRGLLPRYFLFPISFCLKKLRSSVEKLIWDFDDDILLSGEVSKSEYGFLCKNSDFIFVTHNYLAGKIDCIYRNKVIIMPTTDSDFLHLNLTSMLELRKETFKKELRLVWTGSAVNLIHLNTIIPVFDACAKIYIERYNRQIVLNVCSSEPLVCSTECLIVNNVMWSRQVAVQLIESSHIGIMPLLPSQYSLGKGGFKLIQYMAAGLPIIGSNVGYNRSIIKENFGFLIDKIVEQTEWMKALALFGDDFDVYRSAAMSSLEQWKKFFHARTNLEIWSKSINSGIK